MYKYERFKTKAEAIKRLNELLIPGERIPNIYKGHRDYIVQYWVNT